MAEARSTAHSSHGSHSSYSSHSTPGQLERATLARVLALFRDRLGYRYLGNRTDRAGNRNIEPELVLAFLKRRKVGDALAARALDLLERAANDATRSLYDRNRAVYDLLRYGVKVRPGAGEQTETVWLIDWSNPEANDFAVAEEVTVAAAGAKAHGKRPDVVLYVNGIALAVLELKRSTVSVAEGIRQNLDNQKPMFIEPFFSTVQLVMAGNDTEGLRYGAIEAQEKYYLQWKEPGGEENPLDRALVQLCGKARFLELVHDFTVFDAGTKKLCRHNQYFGVRAAQEFVRRREGGIVWHTQGSGKSLTMVWLAKWLRENVRDARVLVVTDRTELDEQIEKVFRGVNEAIYRTTSGADLIAQINEAAPWLLGSLIHKFGGKGDGDSEKDAEAFIDEIKRALPPGFRAKGDLVVFVDECHRTHSGKLHGAMKSILPDALFIGFTGTPLLKADKQRSIEVFGRYIHAYRFDEAVRDGVVLDLRYEARDIDQAITSQAKIDQWFEAKTKGLTDLAKAQLKQRWGTMQKVLSCRDRLGRIAADILLDMEERDRLRSGHGNALLVAGSIYEACKFHEIFSQAGLAGKCAIVTSYEPTAASVKGEESGEGETQKVQQYEVYRKMLADWFHEPPEAAVRRIEEFERDVKRKFVDEPGQMKLLVVVDMLLTGFDAPSATYLYIDKQMRDHRLFQAICRVNRLDGDDKRYGYIVDYKDLFKSLEGAVRDYTSGAFDQYEKADVAGLLQDRLAKGRDDLEEALEAVRALCEPVEAPRDQQAYLRYFSSRDHGDAAQLKANEPRRLALYKLVSALLRAYAAVATEMAQAGYTDAEARAVREEVAHFEGVRDEVKHHSGDAIDLKRYEPAMRHLIDTYIRAEESERISAFDDLSLIELIVERGADAVGALPKGLRGDRDAAAETIENNVRRLIIDEQPVNPKYYERMSELLEALIEERRQGAVDYEEYLRKIVELTKKARNPSSGAAYPTAMDTPGKRALYDNLGANEERARLVDMAVQESRQDGWRGHRVKTKRVRNAIKAVLDDDERGAERMLGIVEKQNEY